LWRHQSSYDARLRDQKLRETSKPAHTIEQNTNIHIANIRIVKIRVPNPNTNICITNIRIANIHITNLHNTNMHSTDIHSTDIDNDKVPPNILHRDLFGVDIFYEKKPLAIYDNAEATYEAQGDASEPTEHVGYFSGLINKILVRPIVLTKSNRTMHMSFSLMPGFDFRSGNAVLVELRIGSTTRKSEVISKDDHEAKHPDSASGFHWSRVQLADASQGTMVITVTRGIKAKKVRFVPLVGKDGEPYSIEIEWRVLNTRLGGTVGSEDGQPNASYGATPKLERTTTPPRAGVKPTVTKLVTSAEQQESVTSAIATTTAKPHPLDNDESTVHLTPLATPETPNHHSDATVHAGFPGVPFTAIPTQSTVAKPLSSKRNAAEAFGPMQADGNKSIKKLKFQLRKAQAGLGVAAAQVEQLASKVSRNDTEYHQALHSKAKAVYRVAEVKLEIKAAELGGKKDSEYLELKIRKAKAHLEVVQAEEVLLGENESQT